MLIYHLYFISLNITTNSNIKLGEIFALYGNPFTRGTCKKNFHEKIIKKFFKRVNFERNYQNNSLYSFNIKYSFKHSLYKVKSGILEPKFILLKNNTMNLKLNRNKTTHFLPKVKYKNCFSFKNSTKGNYTLNTRVNTNTNKLSNNLAAFIRPLDNRIKRESKISLSYLNNNEKEMSNFLINKHFDSLIVSNESINNKNKLIIKNMKNSKINRKNNN